MDLAFFGLTSEIIPQVRANLFNQIHEIVFHGQGGYDWGTVYNMPSWLRKFTFNRLQTYYKEKNNEQNEDLATQSKKIKEGKVDVPNHFKGQMNALKKLPKY